LIIHLSKDITSSLYQECIKLTCALVKKGHGTFSFHGLLRGSEGAKAADRLPWLPQEYGGICPLPCSRMQGRKVTDILNVIYSHLPLYH